MTSLKKIAATLLERRHRMTHVVLPGDLISQLGSEGMQEALRRTWLVPDMMSGSLTVNCNLGIVAQMEDAAKELCEDCKKEPCECKPAVKESQMSAWETMPPLDKVSRAFVVQHAERLHEFCGPGLRPGRPPRARPDGPAHQHPTEQRQRGAAHDRHQRARARTIMSGTGSS
jgi:hypothetical protein